MSFGSAASSAGGPAVAPPAAATGAGAPGFGGVAPEASGASDLSGEAATAAGASVAALPRCGRRERRTAAPAVAARCRELAAESRHDPGPAATVAGDGRRAADQRERQGAGSGDVGLDQAANRDGSLSSTSGGPSLSLVSAVLLAVGLVAVRLIRRVARRAGDR